MVFLSYKSQKSLPYSAAVAAALQVMFMSHPPVSFSGGRWNYIALTSLVCPAWQEGCWGWVVCPARSTSESCGLSIASVRLCWSWVHLPQRSSKKSTDAAASCSVFCFQFSLGNIKVCFLKSDWIPKANAAEAIREKPRQNLDASKWVFNRQLRGSRHLNLCLVRYLDT